MNRYQVLEVIADGNTAQIQALNLHASMTSIYWYYPQTRTSQLQVIDVKLQIVHDWHSVMKHMIFENLKRIQNMRRIEFRVLQFLHTSSYIDANQTITNKGLELIHEIERPTTFLTLGHIKTTSKLMK